MSPVTVITPSWSMSSGLPCGTACPKALAIGMMSKMSTQPLASMSSAQRASSAANDDGEGALPVSADAPDRRLGPSPPSVEAEASAGEDSEGTDAITLPPSALGAVMPSESPPVDARAIVWASMALTRSRAKASHLMALPGPKASNRESPHFEECRWHSSTQGMFCDAIPERQSVHRRQLQPLHSIRLIQGG